MLPGLGQLIDFPGQQAVFKIFRLFGENGVNLLALQRQGEMDFFQTGQAFGDAHIGQRGRYGGNEIGKQSNRYAAPDLCRDICQYFHAGITVIKIISL